AGDLERHVRGVDRVELAVHECHSDVDHRVAREHALLHRLDHALLDRWDELTGDGTSEDLVDELEAGATWERLDLDAADPVLAVASGLLDVPAQTLARALDRL